VNNALLFTVWLLGINNHYSWISNLIRLVRDKSLNVYDYSRHTLGSCCILGYSRKMIMIDCLLTLVLPCYIYHKKSLHGQKEKVSQSSYHSRRITLMRCWEHLSQIYLFWAFSMVHCYLQIWNKRIAGASFSALFCSRTQVALPFHNVTAPWCSIQGCRRLAAWGHDVCTSVNISAINTTKTTTKPLSPK